MTNRHSSHRIISAISVFALRALIALVVMLASSTNANVRGGTIALHTGSTDPAAEGFTTGTFGAPSTFGPISNDQGVPAWSIAGTGQSSQFGYLSSAPTAMELATITSQGFTMTMTARVILGLAPIYDSTNFVVIAGTDFTFNGKRWEMDLGLNANGDTVVVVPNSINNTGPGESIQAPGASYTLVGSGSSYHTYQLLYNPTTMDASLFVDGIDRIDGYTGGTTFLNPGIGLIWNAFSGGQGNFNLAELQTGMLTSVAEPSSLALAGTASMAGLGLWSRRRRGR
jgi:hypothetical protein